MGEVIGKEPCPKCREDGGDETGDNLIVYEDGQYCFACGYSAGEYNNNKGGNKESIMTSDKIISVADNTKLKEVTTSDVTFRGIRPETNKYFGVRYFLDADENPVSQFVPCTIDGELSGYKKRKLPKQFGSPVGETGKICDLIGQFRFTKNSKYICLIVGGEVDMLSAYQMIRDYQINSGKSEYDPIAVVTSSIGESGSAKQAKKQYAFFNKFEKIIIGLDNDKAGHEATEELVKVLPKGKVYTANWRFKDPNSYIWNNETGEAVDQAKKFISDFYAYKKYVPVGIIGSDKLYDKLMKHALTPKIPLPPFMRVLEREMAGGIPLGYIVNFGAASGIGKTSLINEMLYYWIYNSPHLMGVVSTELEAGQYSEAVLSRHLGKKISLIQDVDEKVEYLSEDSVAIKANELFCKDNGDPRWHLVDDRDGSIETVQTTIEELIVSCSCKVIVIDVLHDLLDGMSNEEQSMFMKWQKSMVKSHMVTFININHTRKSGGDQTAGSAGAFITEEDFAGSGTIFKSAGANVLLMRNKYDDDPIEKNTTKVMMSKCRWSGNTGWAGEYYYDNATHTLFDKEEWLKDNKGNEF